MFKARLNISYLKNEKIAKDFYLSGDMVDLNLQARMEVGESFHFIAHGYEWMGNCTRVHHLLGEVAANVNNHLPMFTLVAEAVRKIPT